MNSIPVFKYQKRNAIQLKLNQDNVGVEQRLPE